MNLGRSFRKRIAEHVGHQLLFKDRVRRQHRAHVFLSSQLWASEAFHSLPARLQVYTHEDWAYQKTWKRYLPRPITRWAPQTWHICKTLKHPCVQATEDFCGMQLSGVLGFLCRGCCPHNLGIVDLHLPSMARGTAPHSQPDTMNLHLSTL